MMTMRMTMMEGPSIKDNVTHARAYERKLFLLENCARLARKWRTCARILADAYVRTLRTYLRTYPG